MFYPNNLIQLALFLIKLTGARLASMRIDRISSLISITTPAHSMFYWQQITLNNTFDFLTPLTHYMWIYVAQIHCGWFANDGFITHILTLCGQLFSLQTDRYVMAKQKNLWLNWANDRCQVRVWRWAQVKKRVSSVMENFSDHIF